MKNLHTEKHKHWRDTQLSYDDELYTYSKYTNVIIRKGHRLVVGICERITRDSLHSPIILDIGCGWTDFYGKLEHVISTYIGMEPATGQIIRAKSRQNKFLIRGVGENILLQDSCVDIALLISVLDHCFDVKKTVKETFRVLKPGGTAIILLENRGRFSNDIRELLNMKVSHGNEHLYYFTIDDVLPLVKPYGKVNVMYSYGFMLGFDLISKYLPDKLISSLSEVSDNLLGSLSLKKGQHFLLTAVKYGSNEASPLRFTCPHCSESFTWGARQCSSCKHKLRWIRPDILDTIDEKME